MECGDISGLTDLFLEALELKCEALCLQLLLEAFGVLKL